MRRGSFIPRPPVEAILAISAVNAHEVCFTIEEKGPTSFLLSPLDNFKEEYKVSIGSEQKCTCHSNGACIHIIYLLMRYFGVADSNEILWQTSLTDHEIDSLLDGRYARSIVKKKQEIYHTKSGKAKVKRLPVGPEDVCPICYDTLIGNSKVTWCRLGCGGNFHLPCVMQWIKTRLESFSEPSCPMCRCVLDPDVLQSTATVLFKPLNIKKPKSKLRSMINQSLLNTPKKQPKYVIDSRYRAKSMITHNPAPIKEISAEQYAALLDTVHVSAQRSPPIHTSVHSRLQRITNDDEHQIFPFDSPDGFKKDDQIGRVKTARPEPAPFISAAHGGWLTNGEEPLVFNRKPIHPPKLSKAPPTRSSPSPMVWIPALMP